MNKITLLLANLCAALVLVSCTSKQQKPPVPLPSHEKATIVKVPFEERGNVKVLAVKLNGVSMDMIYDTGCSGVHLSLLELQQLAKQGQFSQSDVIGTEYARIADGSIVENGKIMLRSVEIAPNLVLNNVEASVALNQEAPILLGNEVLNKIARKIEVDNTAKTINFTK